MNLIMNNNNCLIIEGIDLPPRQKKTKHQIIYLEKIKIKVEKSKLYLSLK